MHTKTTAAVHLHRVILAAVCVSGFSCRGEKSSVGAVLREDWALGCFGEKGEPPLFRVDRQDGKYVAVLKSGSRDEDTVELRTATREVVEELFGDDAPQVDDGLMAVEGGLGVFKIKSGAPIKDKEPDTDYIGIIPLGGGSIYKMPCPG